MSREERQALLHDSSASTSATLSAFVEIVFDNTDKRFPHGSGDDLVLRRTIGLKKDEYSLDRKSVTKSDVLNLLEAAGFSRSNPYYIVPQGRITHLTNMKDTDRLNLLKDVAGTHVYENKRFESIRLMEETNSRLETITGQLDDLNSRLQELDEERKELKEYHEKDKERRCLEYALYYKQQQDALGRQEDLTARKEQEVGKIEAATRRFNEEDEALDRLERSLASIREEATRQKAERDSLVEERRDLARKKAALESSIQDEEARSEQTQESRADLEARKAELDSRISEVEGELMGLLPLLEDEEKELAQARSALEDIKAKSSVLVSKQARSNQYRTKAERDAALREEITSLEQYQTSQTTTKREVQVEINEMQSRVAGITSDLSTKVDQMNARVAFVQERAEKWEKIKSEEDELIEKRKSLWKEERKLKESTRLVNDKLEAARKVLGESMDRATANGLRAVETIAARLGLDGVYGPVYKLFTVEDRYKRAVETTAGQR
jgi:structural maintenance of chromosome 3 (chondroitin sulfate proteoglycan 6)